jgi:hypothetical protein
MDSGGYSFWSVPAVTLPLNLLPMARHRHAAFTRGVKPASSPFSSRQRSFAPPATAEASTAHRGVAIANVLVNDTLGGAIASSASVVLTAFNSSKAGVSFDTSNGAI